MGILCQEVSARRFPEQMRLTADSDSPNRWPIESSVSPFVRSLRISAVSLLDVFQRRYTGASVILGYCARKWAAPSPYNEISIHGF
jgi:hypothetical protein